MASSDSLTRFGATRTIFFRTTVTAPTHTDSVSIYYPFPAITQTPGFTTVTVSKLTGTGFASVLPVLVLTDVVAVVLSTDGSPLHTGTLVQPIPAQITGSLDGSSTTDCSTWSCWGPGQQAGAGIGIGVGAIIICAIIGWFLCCKPRKRKEEKDIEAGMPGNKAAFGWGVWPWKKPESESGESREGRSTSSGSSGLPRSPRRPRRPMAVEVPPIANGEPPRFRVVDSPSRRESTRRVVEVPPEPHIYAPAGPPPTRQRSKRRTVTPLDSSSSDNRRASQASFYYRPRVRDFAAPAAVISGAGVAAVAASRPKARRPQPIRQPRRERSSSREGGPPPTPMLPARQSFRRQSQGRGDEDDRKGRETRHSSRERRKSVRDRDLDEERRVITGGRERRRSREPRRDRHVSRERRIRR